MENLAYKALNHASYNTYLNLKRFLYSFGLSFSFTGMFSQRFSFLVIAILFYYFAYYYTKPGAFYHIKDVKNLNLLFQEFLANYHKLNQSFDLNNPIDVSLLYTYMLHKGYLSKDGTHEFQNVSDGFFLPLEFQVFTGASVCRHDSTLLNKILRSEGFNSGVLFNHVTSVQIDEVSVSDSDFKIFENLFNSLCGITTPNEALNFTIDFLREKGVLKADMMKITDYQTTFNHAITISEADGKTFCIDSTNDKVFRKEVIDGYLVLRSGLDVCVPSILRSDALFYYQKGESLKQIRRMFESQYISLDLERKAREKVNKITQDNEDMLERFYLDNKELYSDMASDYARVRELVLPRKK